MQICVSREAAGFGNDGSFLGMLSLRSFYACERRC